MARVFNFPILLGQAVPLRSPTILFPLIFHNSNPPTWVPDTNFSTRTGYFISFGVVDCIDVFTRKIYKDIVVDSLKYCCENKGMILFGWCIMSNHIHLIFGVEDVFLEPPSDNILAQPIRYHKYKKNDISGDFELVEKSYAQYVPVSYTHLTLPTSDLV